MPEPQIVKTQDIIVASTKENDYGDLIVTDIEGNEYKISNKRQRLFEYFTEGAKVHLQWAIYMKKEYIANAFPSEQLIKKPGPETPKPESKPTTKSKQPEEISGQERGLWVKEVGEWLRQWGETPPASEATKAIQTAMKLWYFAEMKRVLGITIEKKEK